MRHHRVTIFFFCLCWLLSKRRQIRHCIGLSEMNLRLSRTLNCPSWSLCETLFCLLLEDLINTILVQLFRAACLPFFCFGLSLPL